MKNIWHTLKQYYIRLIIFKSKLSLFKILWKDQPWDHWYIYKLEREKLAHIKWFFESKYADTIHNRDIRELDTCVSLLDIFLEDKKPERINFHNYKRFIPKCCHGLLDFFKEYPEELYKLKALYLYHKIRNKYTLNWWD